MTGFTIKAPKAMPTEYKGVTLRSRLEAQAAYLFDALGWEWQYEPKSYMLPGGVIYMPDFYIPHQRMFVECRGYESDRGESQIETFGKVVTEGQAGPDGHTILRYLTVKEDDVRVYRPRHEGYCEGALVVWCSLCKAWLLVGLKDNRCPTCLNHGSSIKRAYALSVTAGKILLNEVPSEYWHGLLAADWRNGGAI